LGKNFSSIGFMAKGNFGEHLRREREMRGVSLEEIAAATRIQTRFLEALENERWETLPGGVFNRGFVRSVANYLGLDGEAMLGEYTLATGDRGTASSVPARSLPMTSSRTPWLAWLLVVVVAGALLVGGFYGWKRYLSRKRAAVNSRATIAATGGHELR
jgi:cytoskeleton protein RodZ